MGRTRSYVTRHLVRRCRVAGPAFNTRGVFGRRVIRPEDFIDPENAPAPPSAEPRPDMYQDAQYAESVRDAVAEQLALIRNLDGAEKEQRVAALLIFLTLNVQHLRANQTQLNAYKAIAHHYSEIGIVAWVAAKEFLAATTLSSI